MRALFALLLVVSCCAVEVPTAQSFAGEEDLWAYELVWLNDVPATAAVVVKERGRDFDAVAVKNADGKTSLLIGGKPVESGKVLYYENGFVRTYDAAYSKRIYAAITQYRQGERKGFDEFVREVVGKLRCAE